MTITLAVLLGLIASVQDLRFRRIPNWLTAGGACAALLYAAFQGPRALGMALAGAAVGFLLLLPLQLRGAMGGGDVKLMAAFGALLGPSGIAEAAVFASIGGAVWALVGMLRGGRAIPYAPAIAAGVWFRLLGNGG